MLVSHMIYIHTGAHNEWRFNLSHSTVNGAKYILSKALPASFDFAMQCNTICLNTYVSPEEPSSADADLPFEGSPASNLCWLFTNDVLQVFG